MSSNIPIISITSEAEEDADHDYLNIAEALTDSEMLDMEMEVKKHKRYVPKLKIKLTPKDGGTTDVEDMQGSGDEEEIKIYPHSQPITLDNLDLDPGSFKESHKIRSKTRKGKKKLHTQYSTTTEANISGSLDNLQINSELTDFEDCYGSDDNDQACPETAVTEEMFEASASIYVSDKLEERKPKASPAITPYQSEGETSKKNGSVRKTKLRRRKQKSGKPLSDESDKEDDGNNLCVKKKRPIKRGGYLVPEHEEEVLTEAEIFEDDVQVSEPEISGDYTALNKSLEELEGYCSSVIKEDFNSKPKDEDQNHTDCDDYKTDSPPGDDSDEGVKKNQDFGIKFVGQSLTVKKLEDVEGHTDVEMLNSSDEEDKIGIPIAVVKKVCKESTTDEETFSDDGFYVAEAYPEVSLPQPCRKIISLREDQAGRPLVTVTAFDDTYSMGLNQAYGQTGGDTDDESLSESEALLYAENMSRGATPDLSIFDGSFEDTVQNLRRKSSLNPTIREALTDTEEISMGAPKIHKKPMGNFLTVTKRAPTPKTDTEDLYPSDQEPCEISGDLTDFENIPMSDQEEVLNEERDLCTTPSYLRQMGGGVILAKEGSGRFSSQDRLEVNKRVRCSRFAAASPVLTDTEDLLASGDDEVVNHPRAATPLELHDNSSKVHAKITKKADMEAPEAVMYLKGGYYREAHTDVEDMNMSDDEEEAHECMHKKKISVDILGDDKVLVSMKHLCGSLKNCPVALGLKNRKEWDASGKSSVEEPISVIKRDAVDAVQKGEAVWPETVAPRAPVPFRSGREEAPEAPTQGSSTQSGAQQRSDQHQLSEEMKQLLKEMEEDSKK